MLALCLVTPLATGLGPANIISYVPLYKVNGSLCVGGREPRAVQYRQALPCVHRIDSRDIEEFRADCYSPSVPEQNGLITQLSREGNRGFFLRAAFGASLQKLRGNPWIMNSGYGSGVSIVIPPWLQDEDLSLAPQIVLTGDLQAWKLEGQECGPAVPTPRQLARLKFFAGAGPLAVHPRMSQEQHQQSYKRGPCVDTIGSRNTQQRRSDNQFTSIPA